MKDFTRNHGTQGHNKATELGFCAVDEPRREYILPHEFVYAISRWLDRLKAFLMRFSYSEG